MQINEKFGELASQETLEKTAAALKQNGMDTLIVATAAEAKEKITELIPAGAEIMNMTSMTLEAISVVHEIVESGTFTSVHEQLKKMDKATQGKQMRQMGAAPDWAIGSVHAITESGQVLIASATGSQLPAYAYAAANVIWVVGAQKVVKNFEEGMQRLYEYSLPLEDERAQKAYGKGSSVNKMLVINKEVTPNRITVILVKEKLGF